MSGWKSWGVGEYVEAGDFQNYVQDQVVQVYANSTARGSALGTAVTAGMMSYLIDTAALQVYGTAWANVSSPGDITAVTAGTALTGGGTSGDVTLNVNLAAVGSSVLASPNVTGTATIAAGSVTSNLVVSGTATLTAGSVTGDLVVVGDLRDTGWTASRVLTADGSQNAVTSTVTTTELGHLSGVTSAIQTQLNARQPTISGGTAGHPYLSGGTAAPAFGRLPSEHIVTAIRTLAGTTTAYTTTALDENDVIYSLATATCTVTVPDLIEIGDRIDIVRDGAGTVVIAAGTGVTSWAGAGTAGTAVTFKIDQQFNAATVLKVAANTYRVIGRVIP